MEFNKKNIKAVMFLTVFAGVVLTLSQNIEKIAAVFGNICGMFTPVFIGLALAFVLNIFMKIFEERLFVNLKKAKNKKLHTLVRPLALIATIALVPLIISIVALVIVPEIGKLFMMLKNSLPGWLNYVFTKVEMLLIQYNIDISIIENFDIDWKSTIDKVFSSAMKGSETVLNTAITTMGGVISFSSNLLIGFVIAIYVLAQKEKICAFFVSLTKATFPKKIYEEVLRITRLASGIFSKYILGQLTEAVVLSTLCFIGMLIFSFPQPLVISVLVAVTALVPIVGAFLAAFIGAVLIFIEEGLIEGLLFALFLTVLQQIEGNLIYPKVVGKTVGLPSILVLVAIVVGGNMSGVLGILLAVPVAALAYTLIKEFIAKRNKWKKN
ncbi:MAG: AI-2E family transporter [Clostridia bacterium]|nr:AI-2E family transporter [Clostridia bacterium]